MFTQISKLIIPSIINDSEDARLVEFLCTLIVLAVIASLVYGVVVLTVIERNIFSLSIPTLVVLSGGLSVLFMRREQLKIATYLLMLGIWLTITVASAMIFGGLNSPTIALYVLIIISVGLMLGFKPAILFAGIIFLSIFCMYLGEMFGIMPAPISEVTPLQTLLVHSINLAITTVLVRQAVNDINRSKALANKRALELEKYIAAMEETVASRTDEISKQKVFFETLFDNIPVAVVSVDHANKIVTCNRAFEALFGYRQAEVIGQVLDPLVTTEETLAEAEYYTQQSKSGSHPIAICTRKRKDGSLVDVEMQGVPIIINEENVGALAIYHDITERLFAEEILKANEARFRSLFEDSPISLWEEDFSDVKEYLDQLRSEGVTDYRRYFDEHPDSALTCAQKIRILNVNQATVAMFKASSKQEMLNDVSSVLDEESMEVFKDELVALAEGELDFACEIHQQRMDGETIIGDLRLSIAPGYEDTWEKVYISIQDITDRKELENQLKESLAKMEILATTDPLTGLLNRRAIINEARIELARAEREGKTLGLALVDMDRLKMINDQHGHLVGDTALRLLGNTLRETSRIYDKVGRWGGDEFLVVIIPKVDGDSVMAITKRLKAAINNTMLDLPDGDELLLEACVGVTWAHEGNKGKHSVDELLGMADNALYQAKSLGRNHIIFLDIDQERLAS